MKNLPMLFTFAAGLALLGGSLPAAAQPCPEEPPLQHYTGGGSVACPCFVAGEEAGAVFNAPAEHYPIEILRIGIGWGSVYGGNPPQLEQAIHIYGAGLPNPGTPLFSLEGPVLTDGVINEYDLEPLPGEITLASGPFTVTLEFLNDNAGNYYAPTMVHDGNGCQPGCNVVFAIPGGWFDACALGVSGDWVVHVIYRQVDCLSGVGDEEILVSGAPAVFRLEQNFPNPFNPLTTIRFGLPTAQTVDLAVFAIDGSGVTTLVQEFLAAGPHEVTWDGRDEHGRQVPSGTYFYRLLGDDFSQTKRMVLLK